MNQPLPILKWAGGKGRLLTQYDPFFPPQYGSYYEPFLGSGAVFFHLAPRPRRGRKVRLSDSNAELINVYQVIQDGLGALIEKLSEHQERHDKDHYYQVRSQEASCLDRIERAARMLYLNKTCYNGLYRVNSRGQFNVPIGRYKKPRILNEERLLGAAEMLQGVKLEVAPFENVLKYAKARDLVYFDPPYQPLSATSSFTAYTKDNFGVPQQERLAQVFAELSERGVKLLLSNSDSPLVRELYKDFAQHKVLAPRFINSKADRREAITELLVTAN